MNKKLIAAVLVCVSMGLHKAQAQASAQDVMSKIYKKYDSLSYITFDVKYMYGTDTLYGDFKREELAGTYTMAGIKAKYNIGDIEFMQNDSTFISVYNKEKFIMVADPRYTNTGNELPMRAMMDSMIQAYGLHYTILTDTTLGIIRFNRADSLAQYKQFLISYDVSSKFLNGIQYTFEENQLMNPNDTTGSLARYALRQKTFKIGFSNYRLDNFSPDLYNENNYIWQEDGEWKPIDKYKGYKVYYSKSPYRYNAPTAN
jgi:hypothetical protein